MANAADIIVNLVAKTGRFDRGIGKGRKGLKAFEDRAKKVGRTLNKLKGALAGLGVGLSLAGLASMIRSTITVNDELGQFAERLGVAADELKVLQIAADFSGQTTAALTVGLQRMTRRINEAAAGSGEAQQAIKDLGLEADKLAKLTPDEQFRALATEMAKVPSQGLRITSAFKLLDTEGVGLVNTMALLNTEGFQEVERSARAMNAVLSEFDTAQFSVAANNISSMGLAFEGIGNTIALSVLPAISIMAEALTTTAEEAAEIGEAAGSTTRHWVAGLGFIVALGKAFITLGLIITAVGSKFVVFMIKPLAIMEKKILELGNKLGLLDVDPQDAAIQAWIRNAELVITDIDAMAGEFDGLFAEAGKYVLVWDQAVAKTNAQTDAIVEAREEQRKGAELVQAELDRRKAIAKLAAEAGQRQSALNAALGAGQSASLKIAQKIAILNENLLSGEFIKTEQQRNALLTARAALLDDLVEAQQKEQGLETTTEAAKKLQGILKSTTSDSLKIARDIAVLNEALIKGDGDRNEILAARVILVEELIEAQNEELRGLSRITEVGLQALRNMQDILADFFATASGGFSGLLAGFTDMLRKMVAQLLARRVLLSFLGLFAGGTSQFSGFARSAIQEIGLQKGGLLRVGQSSMVGEMKPEVFVPRNALANQTVQNLPRAVAQDVQQRHEEGSLPLDQLRLIGQRGAEMFEAAQTGTVVPMNLFSEDVLNDIMALQKGGPLRPNEEAMVGEVAPEIFVPKNVLTFPTVSKFPRAVAEDVNKRHEEQSLPLDQLRLIGERGLEMFKTNQAGTVVPTNLFSADVLKDIEHRQGGGPLAAGQPAIVGEAGPELFIPKSAGTIVPNTGGSTVNIFQSNSFSGSGPLEPGTLIPLLEENNRKLKAEFVDELRRGAFA